MSLIIKLDENSDENEIMENHKNAANDNEYVWYCYFGNPTTKPYEHKDIIKKEVFFIGQGKLYHARLLDIIPGPNHGGNPLNENEKDHMPSEYQDNIKYQDEIAYFLQCTNIKELDYDKAIKNILYYKNSKPYILSRAPNPVSYVYFNGIVRDYLLKS